MNLMSKTALIKQQLIQMISEGTYRVGERLPSEPEMSKTLGVSRETFRDAVKQMELEGRLLVKHGVGTFVIQPLPGIPSSLDRLSSTGEMIRSAGLEEGESRISLQKLESSREVAQKLGIKTGDPVMMLERIRTADGEPVAVTINYFHPQRVGDLFERFDFSGSLLEFLELHLSIRIVKSDTEITVPLHVDRNCQKLLIHPATTVLLFKQLHYDEEHQAIFYSTDYMRNDVFTFQIRRTRN
ncbi:GntR family transcriptional regulator [Paenibacillus albidus]|uniref:GntR family transcriptional regulator n=1 Tax=Paenibacillus albidus TaxID=2041023 RepID=A0A917C509_9BACL|nr:GntR family transcriptional regulator [Paenibacillus albidus]GGF72501.1 GntR family transcriptional regulator [Paenibacillus albidus]